MKSLKMNNTKCYLFFFIIVIINFTFTSTIKISTEIQKTGLLSNNMAKMKTTTKSCSPLCSECSANDLNYCTICQTGVILFKFTCYSKCPEGTYYSEEWRDCRECDPRCPVCWGPENDMCGNTEGMKTSVVSLENEIKDFLISYTFTRQEIDNWIKSLKIILSKTDEQILFDLNFENLSTNEVYNVPNGEAELPVGSFSKLDGVFIPVPSYINLNKKLVGSHWTFHKGMWDGKTWIGQHFPRLPTFIRTKGVKNKIYYENGGYWIWDQMKEWFWIKSKTIVEADSNVHDMLSLLNTIKIDVRINFNIFSLVIIIEGNFKIQLKLKS
jgi:hypothetical protein